VSDAYKGRVSDLYNCLNDRWSEGWRSSTLIDCKAVTRQPTDSADETKVSDMPVSVPHLTWKATLLESVPLGDVT
jgi:hypothetical protein